MLYLQPTDKGEGERNGNTLYFLDMDQQHRRSGLSEAGQSGLKHLKELSGRFMVRSNWH